MTSSHDKGFIKKIDFAIISAIPEELNFIKNKFQSLISESIKLGGFDLSVFDYKNSRVLLMSCGLGTTFAASALTLINICFQPEFVLFTGVAGGIAPEIQIGDVVVAESAFEAEIQNAFQILKGTPFETCLTHPLKNQMFPRTYSCDTELLKIARQLSFTSKNKIYFGNIVTSNKFPAPVELYEEIKDRNALSIDMETSAIYQVAWLFDIPILAIRGISNVLTSTGTDDNIQTSNLSDSATAAAKVTIEILDILMLQLK